MKDTLSKSKLVFSAALSLFVLPAQAQAQEAERRFSFLVEPSSKGIAGESLATEPWLIALNKKGAPDLKPLKNIQVEAFSDDLCTIPATGALSVRDFGLFTYVGVAIYTKFTSTGAGKTYFRFKAEGVEPLCSKLVTISAASAHRFAFAGGEGQVAQPGATLPLPARAKVLDRYGNSVSGFKAAFSAVSGGGSVSPAQAISDAEGVAASTFKLGPNVGAQTFLVASASGQLAGSPATLTFTATAQGSTTPPVLPTRLALSGQPTQNADECAAVTLQALSSSGQLASVGSDLAVTLSGLSSARIYTDAACAQSVEGLSLSSGSSQKAFYLKGTVAETLVLQASALGMESSDDFSATILASAPAALIATGPVFARAGICAGPFELSIKDRFGNTASAEVGGLSVALGGSGAGSFYGDALCSQSISAVLIGAGTSAAGFYLSDTRAENLLLTASSAAGAASLPFAVTPATANALVFASQPSAAGIAGAALASQPVVSVRDEFGNAVLDSNLAVTLASYADSACTASVSAGFAVVANPATAQNGRAEFSGVSINQVGTYYLGVSAPGVSSACSSGLQILAGAAATIVAVSGDAQSGTVGTTLLAPSSVKVSDVYGNAVYGAQVTFAAGVGGGHVNPTTAMTDAAGLAATTYTLGSLVGNQAFSASIASGAQALFSAKGTPHLPAIVQISGPSDLSAGECSSAFGLQLLDSNRVATVAQSALTIAISVTDGGELYADAACTVSTSAVEIAAGSSSSQIYFKSTQVGSSTLVAQASGLGSSSARVTISAGAAYRLVFATQPSASAAAGKVLERQPALSAQDAYGNTRALTSSVTLSAFMDDRCLNPAIGTLSASENPAIAIEGLARFSGVRFSNTGVIYLKASNSELQSACSNSVALSSAMTLAAGTAHTCAMSAGNVKCWGFNNAGSLGNGVNTNASTPQQVTGLEAGALTLGGGGQHSCASTATGLYCWGLNVAGQLGDGTVVSRNVPVAVQGIAGGVSKIVGGDSHTCALLNGVVYCWGDNSFGQLGIGNKTPSGVPVAVQGLPTRVTTIAAASNSTCALIDGGAAYCWGFNNYGQLGNGETQDGTLPVRVQGLAQIASIAPGLENTCALASGKVYCWGRNDFGQLGNGTFTNSLYPLLVQDLGGRVTNLLAGGQNFSCVILDTGTVKCWGQNTRGQLGDNRVSGSQSVLPTQVVGLTSGYQTLYAGYIHACASDGAQIKCWGWGSSGQLGNGQMVQSSVPVSVAGY